MLLYYYIFLFLFSLSFCINTEKKIGRVRYVGMSRYIVVGLVDCLELDLAKFSVKLLGR